MKIYFDTSINKFVVRGIVGDGVEEFVSVNPAIAVSDYINALRPHMRGMYGGVR